MSRFHKGQRVVWHSARFPDAPGVHGLLRKYDRNDQTWLVEWDPDSPGGTPARPTWEHRSTLEHERVAPLPKRSNKRRPKGAAPPTTSVPDPDTPKAHPQDADPGHYADPQTAADAVPDLDAQVRAAEGFRTIRQAWRTIQDQQNEIERYRTSQQRVRVLLAQALEALRTL